MPGIETGMSVCCWRWWSKWNANLRLIEPWFGWEDFLSATLNYAECFMLAWVLKACLSIIKTATLCQRTPQGFFKILIKEAAESPDAYINCPHMAQEQEMTGRP